MSIKALVIPADDSGCGRFRLRWPAEAIRKAGGEVAINLPGRPDEMRLSVLRDTSQQPVMLNGKKSYPVVSVKDFDADVLVLQRPATQNLLRTIQLAREQHGKAVVIDIDDALWNIHPQNMSYPLWQEGRASNWRWLLRCCRAADLVTVTTKALQDKVGGIVVPNFVPDHYLDVEVKRDHPVKVGWGGTLASHPEDLTVMRGIIPDAVRESGAEFVAVGGKQRELDEFGFKEGDNARFTGPIPIDQWPRRFAELDVSLVPLRDSSFNHAKSWLKGLESAALGAVPVMSPTPDNELLHERGIGVLAPRPRVWRSRVRELVLHDTLREEMAYQGREIASTMTYSENAWMWQEAWEMAHRIRHGKSKKP